MTARLLLKSLLAALLMPGMVAGVTPYFILRSAGDFRLIPSFSFWTIVAVLIGVGGLVILVQAIAGFALHGKGTLAPVDPPKVLVFRGLYDYTRNPMYVGVVCILAGEALFFRSVPIVIYSIAVFVLFHLFVLFYEEPHLRKRFGRQYEEYCKRVPRWPLLIRTGNPGGRGSH